MTFEEIKTFIEGNEENINNLVPSFNLYIVITEMLRRINDSINSPENTEPEPLSDNLIEDVNISLGFTLEASTNIEYTEIERKLLYNIMLIYNNFDRLYPGCIKEPYLIKLLSLFLTAERTFEDSIQLNIYLLNKLRNEIREESTTTLLSRKYFDEYQSFLKEKNHNDDYSIKCE